MSRITIDYSPGGDSYESAINKIIGKMESEDCNEQDLKDAIIALARLIGFSRRL